MVAQTTTVVFQGLEALPVSVQAHFNPGLPTFKIVGLPDKTVGESKERIRSSLSSIGISLPPRHITVNLSPADLQKEGNHFDLPIILALLGEMKIISQEELHHYYSVGELSLDGSIRSVSGTLSAALKASSDNLGLICPHVSGGEAAWVNHLEIIAPKNMIELIAHLRGEKRLTPPQPQVQKEVITSLDFRDIRGHAFAKRALEIAAAGGHNVLMIGPPGSGKSMLAARLPSILPPLNAFESLEVTILHSLTKALGEKSLLHHRPYRAPHHSASLPALVGGGQGAKPGEISLAHRGVLFLDELPEFQRSTLESLRQPLETGDITIARANHHITYPAQIQLIAAANPCYCGYLNRPEKACREAPKCGEKYFSKLSGPLLDRIDMIFHVPSISLKDLSSPKSGENSKTIGMRVLQAWKIQITRNGEEKKMPLLNARCTSLDFTSKDHLHTLTRDFFTQTAEKLSLSARQYHRLRKVARTIADLGDEKLILKEHILEALGLRC